MSGSPIRIQDVSHAIGETEVIRGLSFEIRQGEFVAIIGPSGCGKTTMLNMIAGDDRPVSGRIEVDGHVRMVYQQDGLFPWLTVAGNIALGLRNLTDDGERRRQASDLLSLIRLEGFGDHYPHQLSGGMRQRVELARALAGDSDILLLDEPFSALDYLARLRMRDELARILHERPRTVVLVTHDIEEVAQLADRAIVLTERPAQIRRELSISLRRPRWADSSTSRPGDGGPSGRVGPSGSGGGVQLEREVVSMFRSAGARWLTGLIVFYAVLFLMRFKPWQSGRPGDENGRSTPARSLRSASSVTCHLTCSVTETTTTPAVPPVRENGRRFTDFPTIVESMKAGRLEASFMITPAGDGSRGDPVKILYLGHRDGSTVVARSDLAARSLAICAARPRHTSNTAINTW